MLALPYIQYDFQESKPLICKEEFLTLACPEKLRGRGWLVWQQTQHRQAAETSLAGESREDLGGRQAALLGCPQLFYSHAHAASPAGFLCEHASDPELFAISFSKLHIHLTFAFVRTGGKGRKEAWL